MGSQGGALYRGERCRLIPGWITVVVGSLAVTAASVPARPGRAERLRYYNVSKSSHGIPGWSIHLTHPDRNRRSYISGNHRPRCRIATTFSFLCSLPSLSPPRSDYFDRLCNFPHGPISQHVRRAAGEQFRIRQSRRLLKHSMNPPCHKVEFAR
jgi:hypothetical protein